MRESDFIEAIQKHSGIIHKILYLYIDDPEDKQDLHQEIQLQAWKAVSKFRGDSQFSTWLYRVALNTVLTFQKKKRIVVAPLVHAPALAEQSKENSELSDLLLRAIKNLSDVDKAIITLHLEEYDNGEIAEIIGMTKNNVGVKLHRIKDVLKKKLTATK